MAKLRMALATFKHHQDSEPTFSTCLTQVVYIGDFSRSDKPQVSAISNVSPNEKRNDVCDNDISTDTTQGRKSVWLRLLT
jgi:hypothetical protein